MTDLMRSLKKSIKETKGFTLIEVVVSIAVLSIVSVALLQMFTVSAGTNHSAYTIDKAKGLCVDACENFKADPKKDGVFLSGFDVTEFNPNEHLFTKYYDRKWNETAAADGVYMLSIETIKTEFASMPMSYYPPPAAQYETVVSVDIKLDRDPYDLESCLITFNGLSAAVDKDNIVYIDSPLVSSRTAYIPVHIISKIGDGVTAYANVYNKVGFLVHDGKVYEAVADIYLCDVPASSTMSVVSLDGISTENLISTLQQKLSRYDAVVQVSRMSDGHVLAQYNAEKYWVEN